MIRFLIAFTLLFTFSGCMHDSAEQSGAFKIDGQTVEVPEEVDGQPVPQDPGEEGSETLLGIDSNSNGVRDDVERYIAARFQGFENAEIDRAVAMQYARATQIIIQEPERGRETMHYFDAAVDCSTYFDSRAKYSDEPILIDHYIFGKEFKNIQFNTIKRVRAFGLYNSALSGGVYDATPSKEMRAGCDFNVTEMLGNNQ